MTKLNVKEAAKELSQSAASLLNETNASRMDAEALLATLREMEREYVRQKEEAALAHKREEQQKARSGQSRAYIAESGFVSHEEEPAVIEVSVRPEPAEPPVAETPAEAPEAAPAPEKPAEPEVPEVREPAPAPVPEIKETKPEPEAEKPEEPKAEPKPQPQAAQAPQTKPQPAAQPQAKQPKPEAPRRPQIGQIISRPGDAVAAPARPVGPAANVLRMPRPNQPRPQQPAPQGGYGRPAPGQQGGCPAPALAQGRLADHLPLDHSSVVAAE